MQKISEVEDPWDFYLYVGLTLLNWDFEFFRKVTPRFWLSQYLMYLMMNNPDAVEIKDETVYYMDQVPLF